MLLDIFFVLKPKERPWLPLKSGSRQFQKNTPFKKPTCFYVTITGDLELFSIL